MCVYIYMNKDAYVHIYIRICLCIHIIFEISDAVVHWYIQKNMTVFNAFIFECCNDSNYIDIYMYIIHMYIVFFHPVHGPHIRSL